MLNLIERETSIGVALTTHTVNKRRGAGPFRAPVWVAPQAGKARIGRLLPGVPPRHAERGIRDGEPGMSPRQPRFPPCYPVTPRIAPRSPPAWGSRMERCPSAAHAAVACAETVVYAPFLRSCPPRLRVWIPHPDAGECRPGFTSAEAGPGWAFPLEETSVH